MQTLSQDLQDYLNNICCSEPVVTYNFDVTGDWGSVGVTDATTLVDFFINQGATSATVSNILITGNRLQAEIDVQGLVFINLSSMSITDIQMISGFDSSLVEIDLTSNQIVTFNPSIPLPSSLVVLGLNSNQIVTFNPTLSLPVSLAILDLNSNQMTTAGYATSETWANSQPTFTSNCTVVFTGNPDSVSGTNLETILTSKNCTVNA